MRLHTDPSKKERRQTFFFTGIDPVSTTSVLTPPYEPDKSENSIQSEKWTEKKTFRNYELIYGMQKTWNSSNESRIRSYCMLQCQHKVSEKWSKELKMILKQSFVMKNNNLFSRRIPHVNLKSKKEFFNACWCIASGQESSHVDSSLRSQTWSMSKRCCEPPRNYVQVRMLNVIFRDQTETDSTYISHIQ